MKDWQGLDVTRHGPSGSHWWMVHAEGVEVSVEPRPSYCDRGRWIVKAFPNPHKVHVDAQDGFPRYYFDFDRMVGEIKDWMEART